MWLDKEAQEVAPIRRFLRETGFAAEVPNILLSEINEHAN
jgi:hypothetical protein